LVLDSSDTTGAAPLATTSISSAGTFGPIELGSDAPSTVRIAITDAAGNVSLSSPPQETVWLARLSQNASLPTPHRLTRTRDARYSLAQTTTGESALAGALDSGDGVTSTVAAAGGVWWRLRTSFAAPPEARRDVAVARDAARGRIVIFGGVPLSGTVDAALWEWDGEAWLERAPPGRRPRGRSEAMAAHHDATATTLLFGGVGANGDLLADTWTWDGETWFERRLTSAPTARRGAAMAYDQTRRQLVLFGGRDLRSSALGDTWIWDGTRWSALPRAGGPAPGATAMAFDDGADELVLYRSGGSTGEVWVWDGASWVAEPTASPPPALASPVLVYDAATNGLLLLAAGTNQVWRRHGREWRPERLPGADLSNMIWLSATRDATEDRPLLIALDPNAPAPASLAVSPTGRVEDLTPTHQEPEARWRHVMALHPEAGHAVLFGGYTGTIDAYPADTWLWNGRRWSEVERTADHPAARRDSMAAYDPSSGSVIMFGGYDSGALYGDTWGWDGARWSLLADTSTVGPGLRYNHSMVTCPGGGVLLFGGQTTNGRFVAGTWRWFGGRWTELPGENPIPRQLPGLAYDPIRDRVVLFAGKDVTPWLDDTWEHDGQRWTPMPTDRRPPPRHSGKLFFEPGLQKVLMFSGRLPTALRTAGDLWRWDIDRWTELSPPPPRPQKRAYNTVTTGTAGLPPVVFGGWDGPSVAGTWTLETAEGHRPAVVAQFDAALTQGTPVLSASLSLVAGADGATSSRSGDGVVVQAWDAWRGRWRFVADNSAPFDAPRRLQTTVTGTSAAALVSSRGEVAIRVMSGGAQQGEDTSARVALDYIEVELVSGSVEQ